MVALPALIWVLTCRNASSKVCPYQSLPSICMTLLGKRSQTFAWPSRWVSRLWTARLQASVAAHLLQVPLAMLRLKTACTCWMAWALSTGLTSRSWQKQAAISWVLLGRRPALELAKQQQQQQQQLDVQ